MNANDELSLEFSDGRAAPTTLDGINAELRKIGAGCHCRLVRQCFRLEHSSKPHCWTSCSIRRGRPAVPPTTSQRSPVTSHQELWNFP